MKTGPTFWNKCLKDDWWNIDQCCNNDDDLCKIPVGGQILESFALPLDQFLADEVDDEDDEAIPIKFTFTNIV